MENINLVYEAIKFMCLGMGIVFCFLVVLVYILKIQAKILQKHFPNNITNTNERSKI